MKLKTEWLLRGAVESFFVVGSILLALAVDEWAENRGYEELAQQSLGIFERELLQNRARVVDAVPFHGGIRDLVGQMRLMDPGRADLRSVLEGVEPPVLLNTAWETALATGALTHMDVEVVSALSLTYSIQERFTADASGVRARLALDPGGSSEAQLRDAYDYLVDLTRQESELQAVYDQALEMIRARMVGEGGGGGDSVPPTGEGVPGS